MDKKRLAEVSMVIAQDFYCDKNISVERAINHFKVEEDIYKENLRGVRRQINALKLYKKFLEGK